MPVTPAHSGQDLQAQIRHRVANTFHFLAALARLRAQKGQDLTPAQSLAWIADTIVDLGTLERFVRDDQVDIKAYLSAMAGVWRDRYRHLKIQVVLDLCPLTLHEAVAQSVALAILELVANAATHVFHGGEAHEIRLDLRLGSGTYVLTISSSGHSMAPSSEPFGLWLAKSLVQQIKGELAVSPAGMATLSFKV